MQLKMNKKNTLNEYLLILVSVNNYLYVISMKSKPFHDNF